MKLTIIPIKIDGSAENNIPDEDLIRPDYCYLHGELESQNGYDIFCLLRSELKESDINEKWISQSFPAGEYKCTCFGKDCTFFLWKTRRLHGLVVSNTDTKAYEYAKEKYLEKSIVI